MTGSVAKAVILAAGRGTRMRRGDPAAVLTAAQAAAADRGWKALMPIHGRPFLDYGISVLADAGVCEVCIVVGPGESPLRERYRKRRHRARRRRASRSRPNRAGVRTRSPGRRSSRAPAPFSRSTPTISIRSRPSALCSTLDGPGLPVFERERLLATSNFTARAGRPLRGARRRGRRVSPSAIVEKPPGVGGAAGRAPAEHESLAFLAGDLRGLPQRAGLDARRARAAAGGRLGDREAGERFRAVPCADGVLDLSTRADVGGVEARLAGAEPRP